VLLPQAILYRVFVESDTELNPGYDLFDRLMLNRVIFSSLSRFMPPEDAGMNVHLIKILSSVRTEELKEMFSASSARSKKSIKLILTSIFSDYEISNFLNVNEFKKKKYFSKERFEYLLDWFYTLNMIYMPYKVKGKKDQPDDFEKRTSGTVKKIKTVSSEIGYCVDDLIKAFDVKERKNDATETKTRKKRKSK
jgi:hypothetical protein